MSGASIHRGRLQGVLQIIRFNWPMYVAGAITCGVGAIGIVALPLPGWLKMILTAGDGLALFWLIASLVVSFWVYDVSRLCDWQWVREPFASPPRIWLNIHCGFDESTPSLRDLFPGSVGRSLDIFDARQMTEPSILRARQLANAFDAEPANYRQLPAASACADAAFCLLSAHELREPAARLELFGELHRVIKPGGCVVVAEHLRDTANFVAFGPGFTHFHSRRTWLAVMKDSGFSEADEFRITPFVAVFVLRRPS